MNETQYNYKVVRQFAVMTVIWGIVGMLVGVMIAAQLAWPALNFDIPWLTYGRLRPLHTNAVIFAFGGSALFATSYYAVQRTCHVRLFGGPLVALHLLGLAGRHPARRHHPAARLHHRARNTPSSSGPSTSSSRWSGSPTPSSSSAPSPRAR